MRVSPLAPSGLQIPGSAPPPSVMESGLTATPRRGHAPQVPPLTWTRLSALLAAIDLPVSGG